MICSPSAASLSWSLSWSAQAYLGAINKLIGREPAPAASTSCRDYSTVVTPSQSQEAATAMGA